MTSAQTDGIASQKRPGAGLHPENLLEQCIETVCIAAPGRQAPFQQPQCLIEAGAGGRGRGGGGEEQLGHRWVGP